MVVSPFIFEGDGLHIVDDSLCGLQGLGIMPPHINPFGGSFGADAVGVVGEFFDGVALVVVHHFRCPPWCCGDFVSLPYVPILS